MIEEGVKKSASYLRGVAGTFGDANVKCTVEKGRADEVILEKGETDTGMLICMATHGRSGLDRFLLGSVTEKVLRAAANPLLLVRATEEAKSDGTAVLKSIIVPLDGSELAESIIPTAAEKAKELGLEVVLFRAYHLPTSAYASDEMYSAVDYDEVIAGVRDEATQYLEKKAAEVKKLGVEKVSVVSKQGFAADEIIALARKNPDSIDRHVFPRPHRRETLDARQRNGGRGAPLRRSGISDAGEVTQRRLRCERERLRKIRRRIRCAKQ